MNDSSKIIKLETLILKKKHRTIIIHRVIHVCVWAEIKINMPDNNFSHINLKYTWPTL